MIFSVIMVGRKMLEINVSFCWIRLLVPKNRRF